MSRQPTSRHAVLHEQAAPYRVTPKSSPSPLRGEGRGEVAPLTFLDLFCGCGGFTLGMQRAGFHCLAAIDFNPEAVATLRANLVEHRHPELTPVAHALHRDLTEFGPEKLAELLRATIPLPPAGYLLPLRGEPGRRDDATPTVDVIVGGPPCQGYSNVRRVDGSNHGARLKDDPRRHLYREFLRYVDHFQPRLFVMENVLGLRTAAGGEYFTRVQKEARELGRAAGRPGYRVHSQIEDAWELGVPQKRRRQLIIGVRNDLPGYFLPDLQPAPRVFPGSAAGPPAAFGGPAERQIEQRDTGSRRAAANSTRAACAPHYTLWDAIGDLPAIPAGGGEPECEYDRDRRIAHVTRLGDTAFNYLANVLEIDRAEKLTGHVARPHSDRDLRDFARLHEGENSATALRDRGVEFEFPYSKATFKDRYTRQSRTQPCSTIVAHLSKDGLMFIHPRQNRSLTPREAARIQSFPDWFRFPDARTHAFRLIGNAVPPLIGEAVGLAVKRFIGRAVLPRRPDSGRRPRKLSEPHTPPTAAGESRPAHLAPLQSGPRGNAALPFSQLDAAHELERLAQLDRRALRALPAAKFLRGWHALLFLFPGLHPDNALDHGTHHEEVATESVGLPDFERELDRRHIRSGWPVALESIGQEAWRRYKAHQFTEEDFYSVDAQRAGLNSPKQNWAVIK